MKKFRLLPLLLLILFTGKINAQVKMIGTTLTGGEHDSGSIYKIQNTGETELAYSFYQGPMGTYTNGFMLGSNGNLFGMTFIGGSSERGTIVEYDINTTTLSHQTNLGFANGGANPYGDMVLASDGNMYGFANSGGLFRYNVDTYETTQLLGITVLRKPYGTPVEVNGKLYGVTQLGGANNKGTIFFYDLSDGTHTNIHDFDAIDGSKPKIGLYASSTGSLWGMTYESGANGLGTIFKYNLSTSTYTKVADLTAATGGSQQYGTFIETADGDLLCTMTLGGTDKQGAILGVDTTTNEVGVVFSGSAGVGNISRFQSQLTNSETSTTFYGTSNEGGDNGDGTLFTLDISDSTTTILHSFEETLHGSPAAHMLLHNNVLYGMTRGRNGVTTLGIAYSYDLGTGVFNVIDGLDGAPDGATSTSNLLLGSDGLVYGTTSSGGTFSSGIIYSIDATTNEFLRLYDFDGNTQDRTGLDPAGRLIQAKDGTIYGTTKLQGASGAGTIWSYDPGSDVFTKLHDFVSADASRVSAGLTFNADSTFLYGVANDGGANSDGSIFKYDLALDVFSVLHHFDKDMDGTGSESHLFRASDGNMYGLTRTGGSSTQGTIYKVDPSDDSFTKLLDFNGDNGGFSTSSFSEGIAGNLYATTIGGGAENKGALIAYNITENTSTILVEGSTSTYTNAYSSVTISPDLQNLYCTFNDSPNGDGVIIDYNLTDSTSSVFYEFDGSIGGNSRSALLVFDNQPLVDIPDANFKAALLAHDPVIDTNDDGEIQVSEAEAFSEPMDVSNSSITNLSGIEFFTGLTELKATNNTLVEVDLSNNVLLEILWLRINQIASLNLSNLPDLTQLYLNDNKLKAIDLSENIAIRELILFDNDLTSIDLTNLTVLDQLSIRGNQLSEIDLSQNTQLTDLYIHSNSLSAIDLSNNLLLEELLIFNNDFKSLDVTLNTNLRVLRAENNDINVLDLSKNSSLSQLNAANNQLTSLEIQNGNNASITLFNTTNNPNLTCIQVDNVAYATTNFTDVDSGVIFSTSECPVEFPDAHFKAALLAHDPVIDTNTDGEIQFSEAEAFEGTLDVHGSEIADLTGLEFFTNITTLYAYKNNLSSVDLSKNTELGEIQLSVNNITSVDLSKNTALFKVLLDRNELTAIDVSSNAVLTDLRLDSNPLVSLDLSENALLRTLFINNIGFTSIDLSENPQLSVLRANNNNLTDVIFAENPMVKNLQLMNNDFSMLDLSSFELLTGALLSGNNLTSLNIQNGANTSLTSFDATGNSDLICILVDDINHFESNFSVFIDEQSSFLTECLIEETEILSFTLAEQTGPAIIESMNATIDVEVAFGTDITALNPTIELSEGALISPTGAQDFTNPVTYTVTAANGVAMQEWIVTTTVENKEKPLGLKTQEIAIYPNPVVDFLTINSKRKAKVKLIDSSGKQLLEKSGTALPLDMTPFEAGLYILLIEQNEELGQYKIIKKD